jgi:hypothetical protein
VLAFDPVVDDRVLVRMRRYLLALLAIGCAGTTLELLLLGHFEEFAQYAPLVLLVLGAVAAGWHLAAARALSARVLQAVMLMFVASGAIGIGLHFRGNVEFEREMYPDMAGFELIGKTLTGATPVLAPATMTLLGGVGLLAVYRFSPSQ